MSQKFLFIHIPKTGGRSIRQALGLNMDYAHQTLEERFKADQSVVGPDTFRFTCVRNPWDRVASMWLFFGHFGPPQSIKTFPDWIRARHRHFKMHGENIRPRVSQMMFCCDDRGTMMMDDFIRFENLEHDFARVASELGISATLPKVGTTERFSPISGLSADQKKERDRIALDYTSAYDSQELIDAVAEMDRHTIDRFGYVFK